MSHERILKRRRALKGTTACLLASLVLSAPAAGQEQEQEQEGFEEEAFETMVVTGSRIKRLAIDNPTPITSLSDDQLEAQGAVNLADVLNQIPALGSTFSGAASSGFIGTAGLSSLDLRRLGIDRTLVLVNGRRHVATNPGSAAVDINSIPQELIESVDVITGGASAVYGADAVTGVVNFVTKRDYEGFTLTGQAGQADEGNSRSYTVRGLLGGNFADGRGNAVVSFEFSDTTGFLESQRSFSSAALGFLDNPEDTDTGALDADGNSINDGIPDELLFSGLGLNFISEFGQVAFLGTPTGGFAGSVVGDDFFFAEDGTFAPVPPVGVTDGGTSVGGLLQLNNSGLDATLQPDVQRVVSTAQVTYELLDNLDITIEAKYVNTQAATMNTPAFTTGTALFINENNPFVTPAVTGFLADQEAALSAAAGAPVDVGGFFLARIGEDLGLRGEQVERQLFRTVGEINYDFSDNLNFNLAYVYGRSTSETQQLNNRINDRFFAAADAVALTAEQIDGLADGVNFVNPATGALGISGVDTPAVGDAVCDAVVNPDSDVPTFAADGCIPINLLGGFVSPEGRDFVNANGFLVGAVEQSVVTGVISGDTRGFFELPGGPIGFAIGGEYRREESSEVPTEVDQIGLTFLNIIPPTVGDFDVGEAFVEVSLPVLSDLPFVKQLVLEGAARYANYSTVGDNVSFSGRFFYQPFDDLRIRGTYSRAVRAPNIGELFGPQSQTFLGFEDPCDVVNIDDGPDPALRAANCAALGLPADFVEDETRGTQPGVLGGNPDLDVEVANTFTIGFGYTPSFIPGLSLSVDYYDIEIDDAIDTPGLQDVLDNCVDAPSIDNSFCDSIERSTAAADFGQVIGFTLIDDNIAATTTEGIDIEVNYNFDIADLGIGDYGNLNLRVIGTYVFQLIDFDFQEFPDVFDEEQGELGDPRFIYNFNLDYRFNKFGLNYELRTISDQLLVEQDVLAENPDSQDPNSTGVTFFHDVRLSYQLFDQVQLFGGVDNITQDFPPFGLEANTMDGAIFNNIGRFYYAGARFQF